MLPNLRGEMFPTPLKYEPTNLTPCFILRSRREANTIDSANSRMVNHWQTDAPIIQKEVSGNIPYMDMNPTVSRLYREDLRQSQPYVIQSEQNQKGDALNIKINQTLETIQNLENKLQENNTNESSTIKKILSEQNDKYQLLLTQQKYSQTDSLSENPYFNKYDVASDSRNIIRELRAVVSEDVVDRGIHESQKLLQREMENRWTPQGFAVDNGIDSLSAFELMRPNMNNMGKRYN